MPERVGTGPLAGSIQARNSTVRGGRSWGGAEAQVVVAVARVVPVAVGGTAVGGVVVPRAAAVHAVVALARARFL